MLRTLSVVVAALAAFPASANVMTFTDLPPRISAGSLYTEDGITMSGSGIGLVGVDPGYQHLDGFAPGPRIVDFTTGALFTPVSIDVHPHGSGYCPPEDVVCLGLTPYTNLWVSGFVGEIMTSSLGFSTDWEGWQTIAIDALGLVDRLRVEIKLPSALGLPGDCWASCGHFSLDNVTVSVPEPATLSLFSVCLLGMLARRRRAK